MHKLRLGVNIDHVATLRNARGISHPDPIRAAILAKDAGADGITVHLREDRRHIRDSDVTRLIAANILPINLEMAATEEMLDVALQHKPNACCIVPEKRAELTTEGGLDVLHHQAQLTPFIAKLKDAGIRVSLFVDADIHQLEAAAECGADIVELHTGAYAEADNITRHIAALQHAATYADRLGLECHAGHGLNYENVYPIAAIPELHELNIGHFIMGEAMFVGMIEAVQQMRAAMEAGRKTLLTKNS